MARGTLIPETYVPHAPTVAEIALASIIWGLSLGISLCTFVTAAKHTVRSRKRTCGFTVYMVLIWLEWTASNCMGVISWLFLKSIIGPNLEYFLAISVVGLLSVDAGINLYFIHLVRSWLMSNGLTKYNPLFRFNLVMIGVPMSLDVRSSSNSADVDGDDEVDAPEMGELDAAGIEKTNVPDDARLDDGGSKRDRGLAEPDLSGPR